MSFIFRLKLPKNKEKISLCLFVYHNPGPVFWDNSITTTLDNITYDKPLKSSPSPKNTVLNYNSEPKKKHIITPAQTLRASGTALSIFSQYEWKRGRYEGAPATLAG